MELLIPPGRACRTPALSERDEVLNGFSMCCEQAGNWDGTWSVFLMRSTWRCASRWDGKQARQQRLSIRRAQWVSNPTGYHAGKSAPKARVTYGGRFHPDSCRLIWKLTLAGCNASEVRAGLERVDADADPSFARGRSRGHSNRHMPCSVCRGIGHGTLEW